MIPIAMGVRPEVIQDNPDHLDELVSHSDHPFPQRGRMAVQTRFSTRLYKIGLSGRIRMCDI